MKLLLDVTIFILLVIPLLICCVHFMSQGALWKKAVGFVAIVCLATLLAMGVILRVSYTEIGEENFPPAYTPIIIPGDINHPTDTLYRKESSP